MLSRSVYPAGQDGIGTGFSKWDGIVPSLNKAHKANDTSSRFDLAFIDVMLCDGQTAFHRDASTNTLFLAHPFPRSSFSSLILFLAHPFPCTSFSLHISFLAQPFPCAAYSFSKKSFSFEGRPEYILWSILGLSVSRSLLRFHEIQLKSISSRIMTSCNHFNHEHASLASLALFFT